MKKTKKKYRCTESCNNIFKKKKKDVKKFELSHAIGGCPHESSSSNGSCWKTKRIYIENRFACCWKNAIDDIPCAIYPAKHYYIVSFSWIWSWQIYKKKNFFFTLSKIYVKLIFIYDRKLEQKTSTICFFLLSVLLSSAFICYCSQ